jgi:hypothetical protein
MEATPARLRARGAVRVGGDLQAVLLRFLDRGAQFLEGEFLPAGPAAQCQDRARRQHLDHAGAAARDFAHPLAHLVRPVGLAEAQLERQLDVGREAGQRAGAAGDRHVGA